MCFVAIPALKSHVSLRNDSASVAFPSPGNPLAQEIMSLYQEPDGTRRLLNYLLDNLAGAIKRSKLSPSTPLLVLTLAQELLIVAKVMMKSVFILFPTLAQYQRSSPQLGHGFHSRNQIGLGHQVRTSRWVPS